MNKRILPFIAAVAALVSVFLMAQVRYSPATTVMDDDADYSDDIFSMHTARDTNGEFRKVYGEGGDSFSQWLRSGRDPSVVPAVVAGVVRDGTFIFHSGVNADLDTPMGIASLTKTFTAVLALRLAEEGVLSLDDPVRKYLPDVKIERDELGSRMVTVRDLLAHLSGMPTAGDAYSTVSAGGGTIQFPRQKNPAGLCYAYNNAGYVVAKSVLESATGIPYDELLKKYIFNPLGMEATSAKGSNGTGGIVTTLRDLAKYTTMLINRGRYGGKHILSDTSFHEMLAPQVELPRTEVDYHYSLSWEVITVKGRVDSYYKAGRWYGESSAIQVFPARKIALIYLCNPPHHLTPAFMSWRQSLTGRLRNLVRAAEGEPALCSRWPSLTAEQLQWYAGTYENILTGKKIKIWFKDEALLSSLSSPPGQLHAFTSNRLLMGQGNVLHNFVWQDNRVVGLALTSGYYRLMP